MITASALLCAAGGTMFCALGTVHAAYMQRDVQRSRAWCPVTQR
jgi:hypothetical protein